MPKQVLGLEQESITPQQAQGLKQESTMPQLVLGLEQGPIMPLLVLVLGQELMLKQAQEQFGCIETVLHLTDRQ
jgi:hypothetical protein